MEQLRHNFKVHLLGLWRAYLVPSSSTPAQLSAWHAERTRLLLWLGEEGLARLLADPKSRALSNSAQMGAQAAWAALLGCVAIVSSSQTWSWLGLGEQAQWAGWVCALFSGSLRARAAFKGLPWPAVLSTQLGLVSAQPLWARDLEDGYLMGYCADTGVAVRISNQSMMRHFMAAGMTGVGKTVSAVSLMMQQMAKGGGVLWVDGKLDPENMLMFFHMAKWLGRESDVRIINPADPSLSNTYNFVLHGEPEEVASRILSTLPSAALSAGADYYKQAANQGLICILGALRFLRLAYNCMDLAILLTHPLALLELDRRINAKAYSNDSRVASFKLFLETCKSPPRAGALAVVDAKKMRDLFGGIAGRLFVYGSAQCGEVTQSYSPDIDLSADLKEGKLLYCALPTMGQQISAQNFGKMVMGDLRTAIARLQALPQDERSEIPFLIWLDEVASYASAPALATPFQQSRSAHLSLGVGFQEQSSIEELGPSFLGTLMGNTYNKLFFKPADRSSAEAWSRTLGEKVTWQRSRQEGVSEAFKFSFLGLSKGLRTQQTRSFNESIKEVREYRVSADRLAQLGLGQAIFLHASSEIFDLHIPKLEFGKDLRKALGGVSIQRPANRSGELPSRESWSSHQVPGEDSSHSPQWLEPSALEGIYFYQRYRDFLSDLSAREETQAQLTRERIESGKARFQSLAHRMSETFKGA